MYETPEQLLKLLISVSASQPGGSRIKNYQMQFPSSVNGSLLTPSFLWGDCPKWHAITAETNTPGLHVRYCKFHNSCKQVKPVSTGSLSPQACQVPPTSKHTLLASH